MWTKVDDQIADLNMGFKNLQIHVEKSSNAPQALLDFFDGQIKPLNNNEFLVDCNTYPTELSALDIKFHEKENIECYLMQLFHLQTTLPKFELQNHEHWHIVHKLQW